MTQLEVNIANAILIAKDALLKMIEAGLSEPKQLFALSNAIAYKCEITREQAIEAMNSVFENKLI